MSQAHVANAQRAPALRLDIVAGLTAAAVVLPKAMAYATVAGLPVAVGLYTAFVPMLIYALLGSSRVLSVSSTTTLAILAGTQLGLVVPDGDPAKLLTATATLTALVGALLLLARLARLGFVANFISTPVLTGFKAGIGLVIVLDQVPKLLGLHITKQNFFHDVVSVAQHLPDTSTITRCTLPVAARSNVMRVDLPQEEMEIHKDRTEGWVFPSQTSKSGYITDREVSKQWREAKRLAIDEDKLVNVILVVLIWGLIGSVRGFTAEIGATIAIILAMAALRIFGPLIITTFNKFAAKLTWRASPGTIE